MIAIIDYGVGNIFSLYSSFKYIGADVILTSDKDKIKNADKLILPGVGAFADAAKKLEETGLGNCLCNEANKGKYVLGICLGMQLLFDKSYEYGEHSGLSLIKGNIVPMDGKLSPDLKIPHIGWNRLEFEGEKNKIFRYISNGDYVYFVHSYFADKCGKSLIASTDYGIKMTAAAANENVYGMQFHPEKSGQTGLNILKAFCEL